MRKWMGTLCVFLGALCLLSSVGFVVYNRWEDKHAETIACSLLRDVESVMDENTATAETEEAEMATVKVAGHDCIGVLSIPVLDLKLPILNDWSYAKLKMAPCRYYGSYYEKDFVIAAHNYTAHFGRLSELQPGDRVVFTDVGGITWYYEVVILETLSQNATEEMIRSGFDLSLYTCTPGGKNRVTVRCNAVG